MPGFELTLARSTVIRIAPHSGRVLHSRLLSIVSRYGFFEIWGVVFLTDGKIKCIAFILPQRWERLDLE